MERVAGIVWDHREPPPPEYHLNISPLQPLDDFGAHIGRATSRNHLPPLSVSLVAKIVHDTAKISVTQLFSNTTANTIRKGAYTFPLPAGCTVTSFSCRIGRNRIVRAKVKPKQQAHDAFDDAVRKDRTAGLLEQNNPEIFTTTLGNIPPNTRLKAEISFVTLLKCKFSDNCRTTTLTIPTYIAPRYGAPPSGIQNETTTSTPQSLSIQLEVVAADQIQTVSSRTHSVTVEWRVGRIAYRSWEEFTAADGTNDAVTALVKLTDGPTSLDRDFVLEIVTQPQHGLEAPQACLEVHPSFQNHKAVMLTIPPKIMLPSDEPTVGDREIIFVADRSGSMEDKMAALKSAMKFFLKSIPQSRVFNIWCFGSMHTSLWPASHEYSEQTLQTALAYVSRNFYANMGGTELLAALKALVQTTDSFRNVDIIILTDGQVWRLDETIGFVQDTRRRTEGRLRFFSLGIGDAVSHALVEGIAKAGGGYAEVIPAASQGGWEDRMVTMLQAASTGHIGSLQIEFDGDPRYRAWREQPLDELRYTGAAGPTTPEFQQSPADITTLCPFLRNRVFMFFDPVTPLPPLHNIIIKATTPRGQEVVTMARVIQLENRDSVIHSLGARALLGDLERGQSWIHICPNQPLRNLPDEELIRREGESLGCKWSLVSKWTSFYAIEEPYGAHADVGDPFLDVAVGEIHEADDDLDLLRPRDAPGQQAGDRITNLSTMGGAMIDVDSEPEDDATSGSDISEMENGDNTRNGDGGGEGSGGGSGSNPQSHGQGGQRPPNSGDGRKGHWEERRESPPQYSSSPEMTRNFTTSIPSSTRLPIPPPTRSSVPSSTLSPFQSSARLPIPLNVDTQIESFLNLSSGNYGLVRETPLTQSAGNEVLPAKGTAAQKLHTSQDNALESPSWGGSLQSNWNPKRVLEGNKSDTKDPINESIQRSTETKSTKGIPILGEPDPLLTPQSDQKLPPSSMAADDDLDCTIYTPWANIPTSTAMLSTDTITPKSAEEREKEELIRKLLVFFSFNGSFKFGNLEDVKNLLGDDFSQVVCALQGKIDFNLAVTMAIIVLLEAKFQSCKDLWSLISKKAREYVNHEFRDQGHKEQLYRSVKDSLHSIRLPLTTELAIPKGRSLMSFFSSRLRRAGQIRLPGASSKAAIPSFRKLISIFNPVGGGRGSGSISDPTKTTRDTDSKISSGRPASLETAPFGALC